MNMPKDPVMLLSFVNTQQRDNNASLDKLAAAYMVDVAEIEEKVVAINYVYQEEQNKFI